MVVILPCINKDVNNTRAIHVDVAALSVVLPGRWKGRLQSRDRKKWHLPRPITVSPPIIVLGQEIQTIPLPEARVLLFNFRLQPCNMLLLEME